MRGYFGQLYALRSSSKVNLQVIGMYPFDSLNNGTTNNMNILKNGAYYYIVYIGILENCIYQNLNEFIVKLKNRGAHSC